MSSWDTIKWARDATSWQEFIAQPLVCRPPESFLVETNEDETLLTQCIKFQNQDAVLALLRANADVNLINKRGVFPLTVGAHKGNVAIMELLIEAGAEVNAINTSGSTAIIQASHFGHVEAVKLLLKNNAASNIANYKGTTALMRAAQEGHYEISECLLSSKLTEVNRKNLEGMSALMLASQRGHAEIVLLLIKYGALVDEQTAQGSTALMLACKRGHMRSVEVLVAMGAEIHMRDKRSRSAKDIAQKRHHEKLFVWLDTQVQVRKVQEGRHHHRSRLIKDLRSAFLSERLHLNGISQGVQILIDAVGHVDATTNAFQTQESVLQEFLNPSTARLSASGLSFVGIDPQETVFKISRLLHNNEYAALLNAVRANNRFYIGDHSRQLVARMPAYDDWMWPNLFQSCMNMPSGVFETIMEFLPLPRVWDWVLQKLKVRCEWNVFEAMVDTGILIDEIMSDLNIFSAVDGCCKNMLIALNRTPLIHGFLVDQLGMPRQLLSAACEGAVFQSILLKGSEYYSDLKVTHAKEFLQLATDLVSWDKQRRVSVVALRLTRPLISQAWNTNGFPVPPLPTPCRLSQATNSSSALQEQLAVHDSDVPANEDIDDNDNGSDDGNIVAGLHNLSISADETYADDFRFDASLDTPLVVTAPDGAEDDSDNNDDENA